MANPREFPFVIPGLVALGVHRMRAIAAKLEITLPSTDDREVLAATILRAIETASRLGYGLRDEDYEPIGIALGLGTAADWTTELTPAQIRALPSYRQPCYEQDVIDLFMERIERRRPAFREAAPPPTHAADWPELATLEAWARAGEAGRAAVTRALVAALGSGWAEAEPLGESSLARLRHVHSGLTVVAVCGGSFEMGLRRDEVRGLTALAKRLGSEEAVEHAKALRKDCRPTRLVEVSPFLLSQRPLLGEQAARTTAPVEAANPHGVARVDYETAPRLVAALGARLPSEAEWEWVARAACRSWLSGDEDPERYAARVAGSPSVDADSNPWGFLGLMWSEWVDDGWQPSYRKAPCDSRAWQPRVEPETVRGGALELWPWQVSEAIQCHVVVRERGGVALHSVRPTWDLPPRV